MLLLALELGVPNLFAVFADTGHEHELTYEYVDYLEKRLGVKIHRVRADFAERMAGKADYVEQHWYEDLLEGAPGRWSSPEEIVDGKFAVPPPVPEDPYRPARVGPWEWKPAVRPLGPVEARARVDAAVEKLREGPTGNPFLDLVLWKGRFPSTRRRFCSEQLKHEPLSAFIDEKAKSFRAIVSWQGVRADESIARRDLAYRDVEFGTWDPEPAGRLILRPILRWSAADVFAFHARHGVEPNPLYKLGMGRVGCMPCIHATKAEVRNIAARFPAHIERLADWERQASITAKRGVGTFMDARTMARLLGTGTLPEDIRLETHGIEAYARYANTKRGGRIAMTEEIDVSRCSSQYGLCE